MIPSTPQPSPERKVPSRKTLELMLQNGPDIYDAVQQYIDKYNLPYVLKINDDNTATLVDTLTPGELHLAKFITIDPETEEMKLRAVKAAKTPYEVLIFGQTGTGKEIIARSMIADRKGNFRAINCAGLPETLIESILFGHVRGAFTGADREKEGFMSEAKDGVLFLDEISELPLLMQAKLLRAIQEKRITKLGATQEEETNCKFVFATNRSLQDMVRDHLFREDLYARISMLEINIKPLKHRLCDCIPICKSLQGGDKFLEEYGESLSSGALDLSHNVRSIQRYVIRYNVWGSIK
jgi:transcriptional regulator with PAS, ATPase and Fis domain